MSRLLGVLAVVAFLARATLAPGYMPSLDQQTRSITITLCTPLGEHAPVTVDLPLDHQQKKNRWSCPYALASATPLEPNAVRIAGPATYSSIQPAPGYRAPGAARSAHRAHAPPTGPPAYA